MLGERDEADGQAWHVPNDQPRMTQGELVRMFAEEAGLEPKISTMGKLMIRRLRDDWTASRGGRTAWRQFHDEFLTYGGPPIPMVRRAMMGVEGSLF